MPVLLCDTGPLVALSSLGLLEILSSLYSPLVTRAVLREWQALSTRSRLGHYIKVFINIRNGVQFAFVVSVDLQTASL